ncbi:phosphoribosyltransferase [Demequina sp. SO4-13]|uniref:phosphoribosyltransferase n=1 Tax=Demequina sp. SO4-13 TaxID=3401027 RepID=UPI003AF86A1F
MFEQGRFAHRTEAGRAVSQLLSLYAHREDVVVLALPRGGVPVAVVIAQALEAPLDVLMVRKLGLPQQPEVAMGAIASVGGTVEVVRNTAVIEQAGVDEATVDEVYAVEMAELRRRDSKYREGRPAMPLRGRTVIIVDDGLATGATMRAAVAAVRHQEPAQIVVAVPVASPSAAEAVTAEVDEFFCVLTPEGFYAVGQVYDDFSPVVDSEVVAALRANADDDPDPEVSQP